MRAFCLLSTLSFLAFPLMAESAALRCGQNLIADGDSKLVVLSRCDAPATKETRTVIIREKSDSKTERLVEKVIEEWTYNFGPHKFIQVVIFENGIVVDVKSAGYGT